MNNEVILYSGGMDSFILSKMYPRALKVYYDLRTRYSRKEICHLPHDVIVDTSINLAALEQADSIVEYRNLMLVTAAAAKYGDRILLGATSGDLNADNTETFAQRASEMLTYLSVRPRAVTVELPMRRKSKCDLVAWYVAEGYDPQALARTVSCYDAEHPYCGGCKSCIRKWLAQEAYGVGGTPWLVNPQNLDWQGPRLQGMRGLWWNSQKEQMQVMTVFEKYGIRL